MNGKVTVPAVRKETELLLERFLEKKGMSGCLLLGRMKEAAWRSQCTSRKISELSRASNAIVLCMEWI